MAPSPTLPGSPLHRKAWYHGWYAFYHTAMTLGLSLRLGGQRNMPMEGPALVIANHQSFLDPLLIGLATHRELIYLARKTLFRNSHFARLIRFMNAVPIDQEGIGKEGIKTIVEQLTMGRAVVVFPEGERTWDGQMLPLKPGIHLLIKKTRAPIVPVGIAGAYHAYPRWRLLPSAAPLFWPPGAGNTAVYVGKPLDGRRYAELPREQALQELFDKLAESQRQAERIRRKK